MNFLFSFFLYLLPIAAIPLILNLTLRLNRTTQEFPSILLIKDILKMQKVSRRIWMQIRQALRMLIVLLMVAAFASPVIQMGGDRSKVTVVIDNTVSMSRFDLRQLLDAISKRLVIGKIVFGENEIDPDEIAEGEFKPEFTFKETDLIRIVRDLVLKDAPERVLLITDGQKYQFGQELQNAIPAGKLTVMMLTQQTRNISVRAISVFPQIAINGVKTEIAIRVSGQIAKGDRIRCSIDGEEVLNETARETVRFSKYLKHAGWSFGEITLEGDDFEPDNCDYFCVYSMAKPAIYIGNIGNTIRKTIQAIFPEYSLTSDTRYADILFTSGLERIPDDKPVFLFCDDRDAYETTLRRLFGYSVRFAEETVSGNVDSDYRALNVIRNLSIRTVTRESPGDSMARIGNTTVVSGLKNVVFFHFSLKDNEDMLDSSVFLLLAVNDALLKFYEDRYFAKWDDKGVYYDRSGTLSDASKPGIYQEKSDGRYLAKHPGRESEWVFYSRDEMRQRLQAFASVAGPEDFEGEKNADDFALNLGLILIAVALAVFELLK